MTPDERDKYDALSRMLYVLQQSIELVHSEQRRVSVGLYCEGENVASWSASAVPDVGEIVTVRRRDWGAAEADFEVDYRVWRRQWRHTLTQPRPAVPGLPKVDLLVTLDAYPASDPPPTFECGECGDRFQTEEGVRKHTATLKHDGTSWRVHRKEGA